MQLGLVSLVFALIGLWYAGPTFVSHFADAIPMGAAGGLIGDMVPGDQYEAYYRHVLPYYNIQNGHSLLYSGYQYNLGQERPFVDGMIYLPFALLASLLAFVIGPVAAYNLLTVLSFSLCAVSGYLLGRDLAGGSRLGGWVCAAIIALLPFRVGFLFGETFYATDMMFVPLSLFFFLRYMRTHAWGYSAAFGVTVLCLATANFALLYWFLLFFIPLFVAMSAHMVVVHRRELKRLLPSVMAVSVPLLVMGLYLLHVRTVMATSGLGGGQDISEVRFFSPILADLTHKWNGIERTVYLGIAGMLGLAGAVLSVIGGRRALRDQFPIGFVRLYFAGLFLLSYVLAFGTTFDQVTGIRLYEAMFRFVPFANGSRTPGRLMPIVATCCAPLAAYAVSWIGNRLSTKASRVALGLLVVGIVALDFRFSNVSMTRIDDHNKAYAAVDASKGAVLALPMQHEADHYLHTSFQYYGMVNNLRMVNGHSSTFPPEWRDFEDMAQPLNYGAATRSVLEAVVKRGVAYLVVHETPNEPRTLPLVNARFRQNAALREVASDRGVTLYQIVDVTQAPLKLDPQDYLKALVERGAGTQTTPLEYRSGWYDREVYPGQAAFRWMHGREAVVLIRPAGQERADDLEFRYKCPRAKLSVQGEGIAVHTSQPDGDGWVTVGVDLPNGKLSALMLTTPDVFTVPTDERQFGCMVGDMTVRQ